MAATVPQVSLAPYRPQDKYIYPPSFTRLLQTNDPPAEDSDATRTIPDMIAQAADDILLAEKEIASFQAKIMEKKAEIRALRRVIDDCNTVLSPIRRLPTDVVLEIFQSVVQEKYDVFDITNGPWLLTHICKPWRTLACTYGALWSSANITNAVSYGETLSVKDPAMLLWTALKRSGTFPLSVWFGYRTKKRWTQYEESEINLPSIDNNDGELSASADGDDKESVLSNESGYEIIAQSLAALPIDCQLMKVLIQHSRQFRYLNIGVSSPLMLKCLRALHGRLDRLEIVHISLPWEAQIHNELQEAFTLAPKLRSVRLNQLSVDSALNFPLGQLRSLDHQLDSMRVDVWRSTVQTILLQGSHLTEYGPPSPPQPYNGEMPRFRSSVIRTFRVRAWYVLDYFHLPGIDELHIRHFGWARDKSAGDTLSAFIHRSGCTLKKLHLRGVPDSILSALPFVHKSLVDLEITVTHSNDRLLSELSTFMRTSGHFPLLSRLEIKCSNEICGFREVLSDCLQQIYAFVDSLWKAVTKVRVEVWFTTPNFRPHRVCNVRKFKSLLDEGLDIAVLAGRKSKPWEDTMGHEEGDDIVDLRDLLEEDDGQGDDWESDDFTDDDSWGEESDVC
ncbi:hypothetical protein DFS33DRAFT_906031 [Desarmillaria ectypa]|nr:hypothetical protein DFS33DRAFT_906031 [Desarmillaria ectypa]